MIADSPQPLRASELRPLTLRLLGGLVLWVTTLYCGPDRRKGSSGTGKGAGLYPELSVWGFREGSSPALVSRVGRHSALLPSYEVVRSELAEDGLELDVKVVHRIARQLGADVLATRTRDLQLYRAGELPAGKELAGRRVGVAIDGGRVRLRTLIRKQRGKGKGKKRRRRLRVEWREPKLLIIYLLDEQGRMVRGSRPWIDGTFAGPDEVMELLCLHLHRLGAAQAKSVTFLADGAPWIWERLEWVRQRVGLKAGQVTRVLDWCHAAHHVSLALEDLALDSGERKRWYQRLRQGLRAGRPMWVVMTLEQLACGRPSGAAVWTAIAYLKKHALAGHMDYALFRRRGIPLGSGSIESAIRRVVNLRLKGNGIMWKEDNAEAMLVLRAAALSKRWEETLTHARGSLATDRRPDWRWQSPDMPAQLKAQLPIGPPSPQDQTPSAATKTAA